MDHLACSNNYCLSDIAEITEWANSREYVSGITYFKPPKKRLSKRTHIEEKPPARRDGRLRQYHLNGDEAVAYRVVHQLNAGRGMKLQHQPGPVGLHRPYADGQRRGNFLVGFSLGD